MQRYGDYAPTGFDTKGLNLPDQQDWLVVIGRNRDSDHLANSNFDCALEELGGESDTVEVHNFGHWACGWLEIIIVAPDTRAAEIATEITNSLADYPILNEEDTSRREYESYCESWNQWGARDFIRDLVKKFDLSEETEDKLDAADSEKLQEFYESLIPSGEIYDHDGCPNVSYAIRHVEASDVDEFLESLTGPQTESQTDTDQPSLPL